MAALILVLRAPGSVHRDFAGDGNVLAITLRFFAQTDFRIQGDGVRHPGDRVPRLHGLGTPYVHERNEPIYRFCVFDHDHGHRSSVSD